MGLRGVEIDAVALLENNGLATDVQFHLSLKHKVELLASVGVLVDSVNTRLGFYGHDEDIGLVVDKSADQRLILVSLGSFNAHALPLAHHEV